MSLRPQVIQPVSDQTLLVARAAFPKGSLYMKMRDEPAHRRDDAFHGLTSLLVGGHPRSLSYIRDNRSTDG